MEIYKYFSEESAVKFLENWCIAFQQPNQFNDPFDCLPNFARTDGEERKEAIKKLAQRFFEYGNHSTMEEALRHGEYFFDWQEKSDAGEARMYIPGGLFFVSCFSRTETNLLMWSHYAAKHCGIVVEFDRAAPILEKLRPVIYSQKRPSFGASKAMASLSKIQDFFYVKSIDWAYEQEERIVLNRADADAFQEQCGHPEISSKIKLARIDKPFVKSIFFSGYFLRKYSDKVNSLKLDPDATDIRIFSSVVDTEEYKIKSNLIPRESPV